MRSVESNVKSNNAYVPEHYEIDTDQSVQDPLVSVCLRATTSVSTDNR